MHLAEGFDEELFAAGALRHAPRQRGADAGHQEHGHSATVFKGANLSHQCETIGAALQNRVDEVIRLEEPRFDLAASSP